MIIRYLYMILKGIFVMMNPEFLDMQEILHTFTAQLASNHLSDKKHHENEEQHLQDIKFFLREFKNYVDLYLLPKETVDIYKLVNLAKDNSFPPFTINPDGRQYVRI